MYAYEQRKTFCIPMNTKDDSNTDLQHYRLLYENVALRSFFNKKTNILLELLNMHKGDKIYYCEQCGCKVVSDKYEFVLNIPAISHKYDVSHRYIRNITHFLQKNEIIHLVLKSKCHPKYTFFYGQVHKCVHTFGTESSVKHSNQMFHGTESSKSTQVCTHFWNGEFRETCESDVSRGGIHHLLKYIKQQPVEVAGAFFERLSHMWMDRLEEYAICPRLRQENISKWISDMSKLVDSGLSAYNLVVVVEYVTTRSADNTTTSSFPGWHAVCRSPGALLRRSKDGVPLWVIVLRQALCTITPPNPPRGTSSTSSDEQYYERNWSNFNNLEKDDED